MRSLTVCAKPIHSQATEGPEVCQALAFPLCAGPSLPSLTVDVGLGITGVSSGGSLRTLGLLPSARPRLETCLSRRGAIVANAPFARSGFPQCLHTSAAVAERRPPGPRSDPR